MIISKKRYQEQLKEAAARAEAETACRMHREKSREEDERRTAEQFRELRQALDNQKQEIYRALNQIDRRLRQVEEAEQTCGRERPSNARPYGEERRAADCVPCGYSRPYEGQTVRGRHEV